MRFRLSTLLLTAMLLCAIAGWVIERRSLHQRHQAEIQRVADVNGNFGAATYVTAIYGGLDTESPERSKERRLHHLLTVIYYLYKTESFEAPNQQGLSLMHAKNALRLLQYRDLEQLRSIVPNASFTAEAAAPFLDPDHADYEGLADFITRANQKP